MKRMLSFILAGLLCVGLLSACQKEEAQSMGVPNPVRELSEEEMVEQGYNFTLPAEAENIQYSIITLSESSKIAQVKFTLNDISYNYRMMPANELEDISGVYGDFSTEKDVEVEYCPAKLSYNKGESGKIYWYDVVPGLLYSLSADSGVEEEVFLAMAEELFVPAQGDVG